MAMLALSSSASPNNASSCMNITGLQANMPKWVGVVPYSHSTNKHWGYATDCSGFVSWALQAPHLKAWQYSSEEYSTRISTDELRYGDVITHVYADSGDACKHGEGEGEGEGEDDDAGSSASSFKLLDDAESDLQLLSDYVSGHVFFFDKWVDDNHTHFWAYESTETFDQTKECHEHKPEKCFNHHVQKHRSTPESWAKNNCSTKDHGFVTGGPHRLSPDLLCPSSS